jgi:hypothetical protein
VQMAKSDPEAQMKSSLSDCTWLKYEYETFNLETLKFLMHFRELGSSFYFYSYSHFSFCFLIHILFSLFLFLSYQFFYLLPFEP